MVTWWYRVGSRWSTVEVRKALAGYLSPSLMAEEACKLVVLPRSGTGLCSGCSEPRYDYRVRQTETAAVVAYLCRGCAMHLAISILEQEVG